MLLFARLNIMPEWLLPFHLLEEFIRLAGYTYHVVFRWIDVLDIAYSYMPPNQVMYVCDFFVLI